MPWRSSNGSSTTKQEPKFEPLAVKQERLPGDRQRVGHAGNARVMFLVRRIALRELDDLGHHLVGSRDGGRIGQLHVDQQVALVLHRDETLGGLDQLVQTVSASSPP